MTTNELIEKYGIGHNCLSDAYDLGRICMLREIEKAMYYQCFECVNPEDLQKWDSGNWFRYKLFENVLEQIKEGK